MVSFRLGAFSWLGWLPTNGRFLRIGRLGFGWCSYNRRDSYCYIPMGRTPHTLEMTAMLEKIGDHDFFA